jgi:hypothetical protein
MGSGAARTSSPQVPSICPVWTVLDCDLNSRSSEFKCDGFRQICWPRETESCFAPIDSSIPATYAQEITESQKYNNPYHFILLLFVGLPSLTESSVLMFLNVFCLQDSAGL